MTDAEIAARREQFYELLLRQIVTAVTGIFLPGSGPAFNQLLDWALGLIDGQFLTGDWQDLLDGLFGAGGGSGSGNPLSAVLNILPNFLSKFSPLNLFNAFGNLRPSQVAMLPSGGVVATNQNLVNEGAFRDAATVDPNDEWTWDGTLGKTIVGALKVLADGDTNEMVSNRIPVKGGDPLTISCWVKWDSLSYTGSNPIGIGYTGYEYNELTQVDSELQSFDVAYLASPVSTGGWQQLTANIEVPDGTTVGVPAPDAIRVRLKLGDNLSSGTVWFDEVSAIKTALVVDSVVPGIGTILQNGVEALENIVGGIFGHSDFFDALFGTGQGMIGLSSRVAYLESLETTGIQAVDDFEHSETGDLGANWSITYSGSGSGVIEIANGHDAAWNESGFGTREFIARYTEAATDESNNDDQKVVGVLGSRAQRNTLAGVMGHNDIYGRMDAAGNNWIRARFSANGTVTISRKLSGTVTTLNSDTYTPPNSGHSIALICGTSLGSRYFQATVNGQIACEANDATSNVGVGYRGWGFGGRIEGSILFFAGQQSCGKLNSWAAIDN